VEEDVAEEVLNVVHSQPGLMATVTEVDVVAEAMEVVAKTEEEDKAIPLVAEVALRHSCSSKSANKPVTRY